MQVRELFSPKTMSASGTIVTKGGHMGGVLCTTAGTIVISAGEASGGTTIIPEITMAAGTYYPMPFDMDDGAYATLGGGAAIVAAVGN